MTTSPRPEARRPRLRERSEAAKNSVAPAFNAAWATPTRRGRAESQTRVCGACDPGVAAPVAQGIEQQRRGPGAQRDVGQNRMQRMPKPGPVQEVLDCWQGGPERGQEALDGRLQTVGRRIEPILLAEPGGYSARDCRPQAFASRAPHPSPLP